MADFEKRKDKPEKKPSVEDLSNMLSDLLILEKNAPRLYSFYRSVNKDKFSSGDMDLSKLQLENEKFAAFRCTSLYKSYRIDENERFKQAMETFDHLKYVKKAKMAQDAAA